MNTAAFFRARLFRSTLVACIGLMSGVLVFAAKPDMADAKLGRNEETFIYAGTCFNGEPYRLFLYQKDVAGWPESHYDYEGPAGKGTVQSETPPKVMAVRVCRKFAEIINTRYWE